MDLGFEAAGFQTRVAVEMDDDCVATLKANHRWPVVHRSIHHDTVRLINRQKGTDYDVELLVLNAADFGVHQVRERAFLIGARDGRRFGSLAPTHCPSESVCSATALPGQSSLR